MQERELILDSLWQRYKPYPVSANFRACTTLVLKRGAEIVCASTIRLHNDETRGIKFLEVLFHAVHFNYLGCGYGSLMSVILQQKCAATGIPKIILHSSLWSVVFWKKQVLPTQGASSFPPDGGLKDGRG